MGKKIPMTLDEVRILKASAFKALIKAQEAKAWSQSAGGGSHNVQRQDLKVLQDTYEKWDTMEQQMLGKSRALKIITPRY